jgi:hypothetical protein
LEGAFPVLSNVIFRDLMYFRINMLRCIDLWFSVKMMVQPYSTITEYRLITITPILAIRWKRVKKTLLLKSKITSICGQRMMSPRLELTIKDSFIEGSTQRCPLPEDPFSTIISN